MKALLVEDNRADACLIREMLKEPSNDAFQVQHVTRLASALECVHQESLDVVLLDLGLPDSRGIETLTRLQTANGSLPIVVLTGLDDERLALEAMRSGAQDYLVKGRFDGELLTRTIRYAVERKRAEAILERERQRLHAVLETLPVMVCLLTPDYHVAFANRRFREQFGEANGRCCYEYVFGQARPCEFCETYRVLKTGQPHHWECKAPHGETIIDVYDFPFTDSDGSPLILEMDIDITEVRNAQTALRNANDRLEQHVAERTAALRETTLRLQALMEAVPVGISFSDDATCQRITGNAAVFAQFGLPPGENLSASATGAHVPGRQVRYFQNGHEIPDAELPLQRAVAENRMVSPIELEVVLPGGRRWFCEASGAPVRDGEGKVLAGIAVTVDVTARKVAEQAMVRAEKLAAAGRMAAAVAHEINNPITAVMNSVYLALADSTLNESTRQHLRTAERELIRVAQLTCQTLGFYREPTAPKPAPIGELLNDVLRTHEPKLRSKQVRVTKKIAVQSDLTAGAGELQQVISNLIANSIDALPEGGWLHIRARYACVNTDKDNRLMITVADNGAGIAQELQEHIFEPFFTTKQEFGTGLGLWVARELLRKNGGSIRMRSRPGQGTVFTIFLPIHSEDAAVAE